MGEDFASYLTGEVKEISWLGKRVGFVIGVKTLVIIEGLISEDEMLFAKVLLELCWELVQVFMGGVELKIKVLKIKSYIFFTILTNKELLWSLEWKTFGIM